MNRRVVVTGVGLVCGCGIGTEEVWRNLLAGKSGIGPVTHFDVTAFDCRIAGEVKNFDPLNWVEKKELKKMAPVHSARPGRVRFRDAHGRLESHAGNRRRHRRLHRLRHRRIRRDRARTLQVSRTAVPARSLPFFIPAAIVNLASGNVSIRYGAKGPNSATATACSASAHAVGDAFKIIQRCDAEVMIAGGSEAAVTPMGIGGFAAMRALSTRNDEPERASRPFDADRDGFVVGEGAGVLILESLEFAQRRGANILAEIVGYGMSGDAYHITQPAEGGDGGYRVSLAALKDAKITPDDVSYVNAHGTSTPIGDAIETVALKRVFGERAKKVPISSTKSMTGHLLGGAGGLEAGISVLALRDQILPPTINYENPDPACDLDYVPEPRAQGGSATTRSRIRSASAAPTPRLLFKRWEA